MYNSPIALLKGIKGDYNRLMATSQINDFEKVIDRVKSDTNEEIYHIPETLPGFKEWLDKRHYTDFTDKSLTVKNKAWDTGVPVDRDTLSDSKKYLGGDVEMWVKSIVQMEKSFPAKLCQLLLDANSAAFDGTAMFATSRSNIDTGSNTINNLLTGTSSSTYALSEFEADYKAAKIALGGFKDKNNDPFNEGMKLAVVVPQHIQDVASTLLASRQELIYVSGTKNNPYAGDAEIIVNYRQASTDNDWYLVNINSPYKPFLIQDREGLKWNVIDNIENKALKYTADFRMGYSFLNPFSIVKTNN